MTIKSLLAAALFAAAVLPASAGIGTANINHGRVSGKFAFSCDLVLDSLRLGSDKQIYVTPIIENGDSAIVMPTVLINGRNMHYGYLRGTMPASKKYGSIAEEVWRTNGKAQSVPYSAITPFRRWMLRKNTRIRIVEDSCGCGVWAATKQRIIPTDLNPVLYLALITPPVTESPVIPHEGRARVQFEVDKTVLHDTVYYTKRSRHRIDNREQLKMIDDTVRYALTDPNVEISSVSVKGYASPESPYLHNQDLATGRSRALAEYLAERYKLPKEAAHYDAVPENWEEFREQVLAAKDITEQQRADLLELIDRPVYGPTDYDKKEAELKTSPKFKKLYFGKILPDWFPHLRATKFVINTRLKPLPDKELAKVIKKHPEQLSLNQMFRVARLYPEGSPEFNRTINIALKYYPKDRIANLNAAVAAFKRGDKKLAERLAKRSGSSPEAENLRGVIAADQGDYDAAREHFLAAGKLPEAVKNLQLIGE